MSTASATRVTSTWPTCNAGLTTVRSSSLPLVALLERLLFISIGSGLAKGGPASLLIAYTLYSLVLALVNNSIAEMNTYMPVAGGFVRLAGYWVDDALGFIAGWNFFLYEALLIPFEITALNLVLSFWDESITNPGPTAGTCAAVIVAYG